MSFDRKHVCNYCEESGGNEHCKYCWTDNGFIPTYFKGVNTKHLLERSDNSDDAKSPHNEKCIHEKEIQDYVHDRGHDYCPFCGGDFA